jgi:cytochrome c biogenesis protein CcmG/thiol:disulfide interchange protein DsbE
VNGRRHAPAAAATLVPWPAAQSDPTATAAPRLARPATSRARYDNIKAPVAEKVLRNRRVVLAGAAILLATLAGCGSAEPKSAATEASFKRALAGAPAPLAGLYADPGRLLEGGSAAFRRQISALRGYPVVVNKWASWCGPCRFEFPFFQNQVARRGKRIAFVAVNGEDSKDGARAFLRKFPVPYPSFFDPHSEIAKVFHGDRAFPTTAFYDRKGSVEYVKQGGYASEQALARDIERYAR